VNDKDFFDAPSPLNDRDTRREAIDDYADNIQMQCDDLKAALRQDDPKAVRRAFEEIQGWLDAVDDNLCERDEDGNRKDGGK
jgi:HPt (histidine-containing phosphotransfer) domain-containing protein